MACQHDEWIDVGFWVYVDLVFLQKYKKRLDQFSRGGGGGGGMGGREGRGGGELTRERVCALAERYENVKLCCAALLGTAGRVGERQRGVDEAAGRLADWLDGAEARVNDVKNRASVAGDEEGIRARLDEARAFGVEAIAQERRLGEVQRASRELRTCLQEAGADDGAVAAVDGAAGRQGARLRAVSAFVTAHAADLQAALAETQGVSAALAGLAAWAREAERVVWAPLTLTEDGLATQRQALALQQAEVKTRRAAVDAAAAAVAKMAAGSDASAVATLAELEAAYDGVVTRCKRRSADLTDITRQLTRFNDALTSLTAWVTPATATLHAAAPTAHALDKTTGESRLRRDELNRLRAQQRALVEDTRIGDATAVREALGAAERAWAEFEAALEERREEADGREELARRFDDSRQGALQWLTRSEASVDELGPVALRADTLDTQAEELQVRNGVGSMMDM